MIFVFKVVSPILPSGTPASVLDGEEWTFQDSSLENATKRANSRLDSTFALATRERVEHTTLLFVAQFESLTAYRGARWAA